MSTSAFKVAYYAAFTTPSNVGAFSADGFWTLVSIIVGILGAWKGVQMVNRANKDDNVQTGKTIVNLIAGVAVLVVFIGFPALFATVEGVRDLVLRGGASQSDSSGGGN